MIQPQQPVTATQEEVDSFYTLLQSTVNEQKDGAFLMGDFNAKLETDWENAGGAIGIFSIGYINEAGEQLIQFANANRLLETNTCFGQVKMNRKRTWESPDGFTRNMIHHILVSSK